MIFEDNVALQNTAGMNADTMTLRNENNFLRNQNEELRMKLKELSVSLEQAVGPQYNSIV